MCTLCDKMSYERNATDRIRYLKDIAAIHLHPVLSSRSIDVIEPCSRAASRISCFHSPFRTSFRISSTQSNFTKMGQTLSEPETTKHTSYGEDDRLLFAVSEMQGWRLSELSISSIKVRRGRAGAGLLGWDQEARGWGRRARSWTGWNDVVLQDALLHRQRSGRKASRWQENGRSSRSDKRRLWRKRGE